MQKAIPTILLTLLLSNLISLNNAMALEVCQDREKLEQLAIENDKVIAPLFMDESGDVCISEILNSRVAVSKNWKKSDGGVHEYAAKYKFRNYIARFQDGTECIDTYVDNHSQGRVWRFKTETDFGTRVIFGTVNYTLGAIPNTVDKLIVTTKVRQFMNDHKCE